MKLKGLTVLRLGLGITFFWIGIKIFQNPSGWAAYIQDYFVKFLPVSPEELMKFNSVLDIGLGFLLILGKFVKLVSLVCTLSLIGILVASGITDITVRDIGLLGAAAALLLETK